MSSQQLLSVLELGCYPEATHVYKEFDYRVTQEYNTRKAISYLKKNQVDVIVAEFNYQHTFRDRLSNLESLIAAAQKIEDVKFIVLYEKEFEDYLDKIRQQFTFNIELIFPITAEKMRAALTSLQT